MKIFTVHDRAALAYLDPFTSQSVGTAERSFSAAVQDENHHFHKHAPDFTLYLIAEFNQETGEVVPVDRVLIGNAVDFLPARDLKAVNDG